MTDLKRGGDHEDRSLQMLVVHFWQSLSKTFEARASEWALAGATFSLALVFAYNPDLFNTRSFEVMRAWATVENWVFLLTALGGTRFIVLTINGAWYRTPTLRSILAFINAGLWFHLLWAFSLNFAIGLALFPWLFGLDVYNSLRAGREAGISEYLHWQSKKKDQHGGPSIQS